MLLLEYDVFLCLKLFVVMYRVMYLCYVFVCYFLLLTFNAFCIFSDVLRGSVVVK